MNCQAVITDRDTQEQHECGKPATHTAYGSPDDLWSSTIYFCDDCLYACMEDASPEEQSTVRKIP